MLGASSSSNGYESIGIDTIDNQYLTAMIFTKTRASPDYRQSCGYHPGFVTTPSSRRRGPTDLPLAIGLSNASKVGRRIVHIELGDEMFVAIRQY
jgi:hypothetical protein